MSAWPACRAVSVMRWSRTHRTDHASTSAGNHGASRGTGTGWPRSAIVATSRFGVVGRLPVTGDDAVEGLVRAEAEPLAPIGAGIERRLTVQDGVDPVPLHLFDVLDEPAHAELAGRRHGTGLVVGESIGGEDEHLALLGQVGEERIALVGHRSLRIRAWWPPFSSRRGRPGFDRTGTVPVPAIVLP